MPRNPIELLDFPTMPGEDDGATNPRKIPETTKVLTRLGLYPDAIPSTFKFAGNITTGAQLTGSMHVYEAGALKLGPNGTPMQVDFTAQYRLTKGTEYEP